MALLTLLTFCLLASRTALAQSCTLSASGGDDAPAFTAAALSPSCPTVTVPAGTTLTIGTKMNMTGLLNKHISIQGTVSFTPDVQHWISDAFLVPFQNQSTFWLLGGTNIVMDGGGTLFGNGQVWYDAFASNSTLVRPIILTVFQGTNVQISNIHMSQSPEWNNLVWQSKNVIYDNININAASNSSHSAKNTDGWNVYQSDAVTIQNSVIVNGDDCVAFKPNATNVLVQNLSCTGSHGISVGSLGQFAGVFDIVENVLAKNVSMTNAQNGARIKAFAGPHVGSGIVKNITFQHFVESDVDNPVVIDQCYMTSASDCEAFPSNVLIQDIVFNDITGTSSGSEDATVASLDCSPDGRCSNITVEGLSLTSPKGGKPEYECQNVELSGSSASLFGTCDTA